MDEDGSESARLNVPQTFAATPVTLTPKEVSTLLGSSNRFRRAENRYGRAIENDDAGPNKVVIVAFRKTQAERSDEGNNFGSLRVFQLG